MSYLLAFVLLLVQPPLLLSDTAKLESILRKVRIEQDANKKMDLFVSMYSPWFEGDPYLLIKTGSRILRQARTDKDLISEANAYCFLGHGYRLAGNTVKGLDYHHKAVALAEKSGNETLLGLVNNQIGHIYKDREENRQALTLYRKAIAHAEKGPNQIVVLFAYMNAGAVCLNARMLDSSLVYLQRAYELATKLHYRHNFSYVLSNLGGVHSRLGNSGLATTYLHMALREAVTSKSIRYQSLVYSGLAEHFERQHQLDSVKYYAHKAISVVRNSAFYYLSQQPARLLANHYQDRNCDSTLSYIKLIKQASDTLFNNRVNQQVQLMTFDETLRQQQAAEEKQKAEEARKQNLQYIILAIGILFFLVLFLLLSRSVVVNEKWISFLGTLALLIVFEFINLLMHPFLGKITHHMPSLMLLGMVLLGALLVPLHHRLEHWSIKRLTGKNREVRLAQARKTIKEHGEPEQ
jgi:tetratricopeptide (TPR) repeat protein